MAYRETYICDTCGKVKGETNHWWIAGEGSAFFLYPFVEDEAHVISTYCSQECVHKAMDRWMESVTNAAVTA